MQWFLILYLPRSKQKYVSIHLISQFLIVAVRSENKPAHKLILIDQNSYEHSHCKTLTDKVDMVLLYFLARLKTTNLDCSFISNIEASALIVNLIRVNQQVRSYIFFA